MWLVGFGDRGLDFELLVWPTQAAVKRPAGMHAAYTWLIADALEAAGLEVPLPQSELRVRSLFGREGDTALGPDHPIAVALEVALSNSDKREYERGQHPQTDD